MENTTITKLYEFENGIFDYDPSVPCIRGMIDGFMLSKDFRIYMNHGLELFKEKLKIHGTLGWLADTSQAHAFVPEDTDWLTTNWNAQAIEAGIRHIAFVMPAEVFAEMSVTEYTDVSQQSGPIVFKNFKDIESAKEWFREILTVK